VKIYTRRGDRGETDLFGGERVRKDALRVAVYGEVDELAASLGAAAAASAHRDVRDLVQRIQSELLDLGSHLATPDPVHRERVGVPGPSPGRVKALEGAIDRFEGELEPLRSFVLPGGTPAAASFQVARAVCRRVERSAVALDQCEQLDESVLRYLNRLSDLLFTLARLENRRAGVEELEWVGRER
jgi:cob(I)alamin adenosyltransferase